jgi:acyl-coenzyme A thioesterase 9
MHLQHGQDDHLSSRYERVWMGDTHLEKTMLMFPQERKLVFFLESCFRSV